LINAGSHFFGGVSHGLAMIVEKAVSQWATFWVKRQAVPSSVASAMATVRFIQEMQEICACSGKGRAPALMPALMAGETMMLVYNLPQTGAIFDRFGSINGSAYFIGGFGMTALTANKIVVVPSRSGIGLRLGANLGYLKFTDSPTWNPF
jgi:hypothetical protein